VKDPKKIVVVALALVAFVLLPFKIAKGKGDATAKKTAAVKQQITDMETSLKTARKANAAKNDNVKKLDELSVKMPSKADEQGFILQLEALAGQSNVQWMSSSFVVDDVASTTATTVATTTTVAGAKAATAVPAAPKGGQYGDRVSSSFVVNIEIRGSFAAQMAYLENLRSIDRLFTVDKLELAPERTQTAAPQSGSTTPTTAPAATSPDTPIHANITLRVYTWSGPGASDAKPTPSSAATTTPASIPVTTAATTAAPTTLPPTTAKK
jgi:hypothetical protein